MPVERPWSWGEGMYSPHIYTDVFEDGWASEDTEAIRASVAGAAEEAAIHGSHLFIGEFGNDPRTERGALFIDTSLDAFDDHHASWAIWLYEEHSQDSWGLWDEGDTPHSRGELRQAAADQIARPFPIAIDGTITDIHVDIETNVLTVQIANTGSGTHLLSTPERHFAGGATVTCDGQTVSGNTPMAGRLEVACGGRELRLAPL